ncbi:uncharacterized protein [Neodiprion pinetum]|uniref:Uncharacterized protein LOC107218164 isoform X1 n=1 Tax=Neodiprion lecontei TaxID=441921 RepID=A0ABM3GGL1_NEOLC|nr:uncharacterized protein LOC124221825 isoform X1 [Neodiprion pinetum]XP_046599402.1 uncharacterized protein LOC107218164 isoform X1 [Neodiprion lecontei]
MACRQVLKAIIRRTWPIMYASTTLFVNSTSTQKPCADQKLTLEPPDSKTLSYDYMIKQSTIDAVNTASQVLTVTYSAIESTSRDYRNMLTKLIVLVRETLTYEVCDSHWDMIVEVRAEVQLKKEILTKLIGFMDYVHKMAVAASETTYLAGMDNLSTTLCQRIDDALINMQKEIDLNKVLEEEYCRVQQQCIIKCRERSTKEDVSQNQQESPISTPTLNPDLDMDEIVNSVDP